MNVLFLDDDFYRRKCFKSKAPYAKIVETAADCIEQLKDKEWDIVFLDHDLEQETFVDSERADCGMEVVRWVGENRPKVKKFVVHTANPNAGETMTIKLDQMGYQVEYCSFPTMWTYNLIDEILG